MSLRPVLGDLVLPPAARSTGTHVGGPVAAAGVAQDVVALVHCTAASGTSPTLNVSFEESADASSWSAIPGSSTAQLTAAGNASANATPTKPYVRVTSTVAGTTPSFTYRVTVLLVS